MTRQQLEIALGSKEILQQHLDERAKTLNFLSEGKYKNSEPQAAAILACRAEVYAALGLVCATEVGMYKAMLVMEDNKTEQNNESN